MATKKKVRKARAWTRWARLSEDELSVIHLAVSVASVERLHRLIGNGGEYIRVRITEVLPPRKKAK